MDVICEKKNRCGLITLNRPQALNALTPAMLEDMESHYRAWAEDLDIYGVVLQAAGARAFCSGGDIRAIHDWGRAGQLDKVRALYALEYQHNWTLERFYKPHVALIDGLCMGGGIGISLYGTHRVGTEKLRIAMPEVSIGFFPDVGATWFLPRLRGETGMYLALTGRALELADAYALGLVTHCIPADRFDAVRAAMSEADPVDATLDALHVHPGAAALDDMQPAIDRLFAGASVEEIVQALDTEAGDFAAWARETAADIRAKSPTALKVAHRLVRLGKDLSLDAALRLEFLVMQRFIASEELYEGIRAALVDKDRKPRWSPATLADVPADRVDALFAPGPEDDLELIDPFARLEPPSL